MPARVGFHLSRVVIVESLGPSEVKTGLETANFVRAQDSTIAAGIPIEYIDCPTADDFVAIVDNLQTEAIRTQNFPLLHVECHGNEVDGLGFRDHSTLAWPQLSDLLVGLNRATQFNLVAVFSACYGGYFLSRMATVDPAPCYAMLAPTQTVRPYEILGAFRAFYSEFFTSMDAGRAMSIVSRRSLEDGAWMSILAESWYEDVVTNFILQQCTRHQMRVRTLRVAKEMRAKGIFTGMHSVKQGLVEQNRASIAGKFFIRYFMIDELPGNATRFMQVKARLDNKIQAFRRTGRYGI